MDSGGDYGRCRNVHFALESAVPTVVLECKMHISARRARRGLAPPQEPVGENDSITFL